MVRIAPGSEIDSRGVPGTYDAAVTVLRGEGARTAQLGGLLDSALALAVAGLLVAEYVSDDTLTRVQVVAGFVVSVVIGVLVMVRRRVPWLLPLAVTLVVALRPVLPAGGDGVAWGLAAMVGAYSVAVYANAAIAWVGLGLTTVSALLVMASDGSSWDLGGFLFYGVWFCGPWGAGWLVRRRRSHEQQLEESVARLGQGREEETRAAVIEERIRIARELHDVVGHALSVMVLQADGGRRLIDSEPDETRDALDTICPRSSGCRRSSTSSAARASPLSSRWSGRRSCCRRGWT
jgi:signal transduction histidine kinase